MYEELKLCVSKLDKFMETNDKDEQFELYEDIRESILKMINK